MSNPGHAQGSTGSVPTQSPQTTPQDYLLSDHSFTLQAMMEMQKVLGQLTQAVITLTEESKKNSTKLDEISHKVYAAQVTIKIIGAILGVIGSAAIVLFYKIWADIAPLIQLKPHP
ncbi:MAG: hypothetical protein COS90_10630 [Deltaproteobacteria bacterium CG07_land_8_20_14_0_80_60_11]|nr:MAG: hypothetical protein COS90_10630 [Deltaproteobacteria bacterium CG07_land_8_20_14_0_80_60_11]